MSAREARAKLARSLIAQFKKPESLAACHLKWREEPLPNQRARHRSPSLPPTSTPALISRRKAPGRMGRGVDVAAATAASRSRLIPLKGSDVFRVIRRLTRTGMFIPKHNLLHSFCNLPKNYDPTPLVYSIQSPSRSRAVSPHR